MNVAVDSSVLIAASISRAGVCAALLEDLLTHHDLVLSGFILDELARKLSEKFSFPQADIIALRRLLERSSTMVIPAHIPTNACRDMPDLPILGTAVAGNAELLVTVDRDLLDISEFQGIAIIRPGVFWHRT